MGWGLITCLSVCGCALEQFTGNRKELAFIHRIYINDVTDRLKGEMIHLSFWFSMEHPVVCFILVTSRSSKLKQRERCVVDGPGVQNDQGQPVLCCVHLGTQAVSLASFSIYRSH